MNGRHKSSKKVVKYLADTYKDEVMSEINLAVPEAGKDSIFESNFDADSADIGDEDELLNDAKEIIVSSGKASTSWLQRKLGIGYSRAAKLIDLLEEKGVVGPANGSKARDVYGTSGNADSDELNSDTIATEIPNENDKSWWNKKNY